MRHKKVARHTIKQFKVPSRGPKIVRERRDKIKVIIAVICIVCGYNAESWERCRVLISYREPLIATEIVNKDEKLRTPSYQVLVARD